MSHEDDQVLPEEHKTDSLATFVAMKLSYYLPAYDRGDRIMTILAGRLPPRTTLLQALTIHRVITANAKGENITMASLRASSGDLIGHHMNRSYLMFLKPTRKEPDNLGWLMQVASEEDRRDKYLRLTHKGYQVALDIAKAGM